MGRRGFDSMRSPRAAAMIALASATGQARTLPASRTGAGGMMPCSMFLMLSVLRGFAVRLRPRHAATSPGREECPEQADLRVVALMAKTALSSAYSAGRFFAKEAGRPLVTAGDRSSGGPLGLDGSLRQVGLGDAARAGDWCSRFRVSVRRPRESWAPAPCSRRNPVSQGAGRRPAKSQGRYGTSRRSATPHPRAACCRCRARPGRAMYAQRRAVSRIQRQLPGRPYTLPVHH
jgi:hypothetical protein